MADFSTWLAAFSLFVALCVFVHSRNTRRASIALFNRLDHEQQQARQVAMTMALTIGRVARAENKTEGV